MSEIEEKILYKDICPNGEEGKFWWVPTQGWALQQTQAGGEEP